MGNFTTIPACTSAELNFEILHNNGTAVSDEFRVYVSKDKERIVINTKNTSLADNYELLVKATLASSSVVSASFNFTLSLIWFDPAAFGFSFTAGEDDGQKDEDGEADSSESNVKGVSFDLNKSDYVIKIDQVGPVLFELPEASGKRRVRLGRTSRYFQYDENKESIYKIDE